MSDYFTMMNGLGGLGLSGLYDPTMMNMYGMGAYGGYGNYGMGMMGMYNPTFMAQMNQMQQQMEKSQLQHGADMHELLTQTRVQNLSAEDRAFFESIAQDSGVKRGIQDLADAIRSGNQDQICVEYDKVKQLILTKNNAYFRNNASRMGSMDVTVRDYIEELYSSIVSKNSGELVDMKTDIKRYGETAFGHGFYKGLATGIWGNGDDYHKRYTEETLNYIYDSGIDYKSGKDKAQRFGGWVGKLTRAFGIPVASGLAIGGLGRLIGPKMGWAGLIGGAAIGAFGDFLWQHS